MTTYNKSKYRNIINRLGEDKISEMYFFLGSEKISFATLMHEVKEKKLEEAIEKHVPVDKIVKECHVSKRTVYRRRKK